ncbi:MAG TPA: methyltransferase domain-containing protein [Chthoniobacterales bacterium]|jgi:SAM-dependent methyltransferase|nr:methyltransferase domain-containing protein [Chthoniobacterales bacterium]
MMPTDPTSVTEAEAFFSEYTSGAAIAKYSRATAGCGISHLLDHDYKEIYLEALRLLPVKIQQGGIRILEFGCGAGMNLLHLVSLLSREGVNITGAVGTDFSPVLIETAKREAKSCLPEGELRKLGFQIAKNETLMDDLSGSMAKAKSELESSFHFVLGVNTIRYCHAAKNEMDTVRAIFNLLAPGGVCVVIDMNNRFPFFRTELRNRLRWKKNLECYIPSLEEYTAPFVKAGFEVLRSEHFCWVPHSAGKFMTGLFTRLSPALNKIARSRAMRSLVVSRKPVVVA